MSLHPELLATVERDFADGLAAPARLTQDALELALTNGVVLTVRYAAADAYSLRWVVDGAELGIDTAPTHPDLDTRPNHLHLADGRVVADHLTRLGGDPATNLGAVIEAVLADPLLSGQGG